MFVHFIFLPFQSIVRVFIYISNWKIRELKREISMEIQCLLLYFCISDSKMIAKVNQNWVIGCFQKEWKRQFIWGFYDFSASDNYPTIWTHLWWTFQYFMEIFYSDVSILIFQNQFVLKVDGGCPKHDSHGVEGVRWVDNCRQDNYRCVKSLSWK